MYVNEFLQLLPPLREHFTQGVKPRQLLGKIGNFFLCVLQKVANPLAFLVGGHKIRAKGILEGRVHC
jgi:hypothetical protein